MKIWHGRKNVILIISIYRRIKSSLPCENKICFVKLVYGSHKIIEVIQFYFQIKMTAQDYETNECSNAQQYTIQIRHIPTKHNKTQILRCNIIADKIIKQ